MATLMYAAVVAYHKLISKRTNQSTPDIKSTSSNGSYTPEYETTSIAGDDDDDDEYKALFPDAHAPNTSSECSAISKDTRYENRFPAYSDTTTFNFRDFGGDEFIDLDDPGVICIRTRENFGTNGAVQSYTSPLITGEQRPCTSTKPIKIRTPALYGQDDLIICHSAGGLLVMRTPVSSVPLDVLQKWTENIVNSLQKSLWLRVPSVQTRCEHCQTAKDLSFYRGCFVVWNKSMSLGRSAKDVHLEQRCSVLQGEFYSLCEILDAYFEYRRSDNSKVLEQRQMVQVDLRDESGVEIIFEQREYPSLGRIRVSGLT
jgi:hypothetical protein